MASPFSRPSVLQNAGFAHLPPEDKLDDLMADGNAPSVARELRLLLPLRWARKRWRKFPSSFTTMGTCTYKQTDGSNLSSCLGQDAVLPWPLVRFQVQTGRVWVGGWLVECVPRCVEPWGLIPNITETSCEGSTPIIPTTLVLSGGSSSKPCSAATQSLRSGNRDTSLNGDVV